MQILVAGIDGKWCWKSLSRSMSSPERMFCMCKAVEMLCKNKLCTGFSHLNPGRHWPFKLKLLQGKGVGVYYLHWQSFIVFAFYYFLKDICTSGSNMCTWQFSCNAYQMLCSKSYANLVLFEWRRTKWHFIQIAWKFLLLYKEYKMQPAQLYEQWSLPFKFIFQSTEIEKSLIWKKH